MYCGRQTCQRAGLVLKLMHPYQRSRRPLFRFAAARGPMQFPTPSQLKSPVGVLRDFRDFILSGNVMDMTIGVLVGSSIAKFSQFLTGDM